jgi:hypothetical protein
MKAFILSIAAAGALLMSNPASAGNSQKPSSCEFKIEMRKLWSDHLIWTRNVIYNIIDEAPGLDAAVTRLLANQDDIGDAIKPYYGEQAGESLTGLLYGHITIAADLLVALKADDNTGVTFAYNEWRLNADSIAMLLSSANPNWTFEELQHMLHEHLELTAAEATTRHAGQYEQEVIAFEQAHVAILEMSDFLAEGIIQQFPNKFTGGRGVENVDLSDNPPLIQQNVPNPFTDKTMITYYVPEYSKDAKIVFYDSNGNIVQTVPISQSGEGSLNVSASNLGKGVFTYTIIVDGKVVDTKKMVHE